MDNEKGRGIFYGVMGVATLVVTLIGATFAYFSASITSNNITTNATSIDLQISENTAGLNYQLIPIDETTAAFDNKGEYIGAEATSTPKGMNCVDDDGNEFCSVYEFTITNPSQTTAQEVYAQLDVYTNSFNTNAPNASCETVDGATVCDSCDYLTNTGESMYCSRSNLAFAIFKGTAADVNDAARLVNNVSTADSYTGNKGWVVTDTAVTTTYTSDGTTTANDGTTAGNTSGTNVIGKLGDMVVGRTAVPTVTAGSYTYDQSLLAPLHQTLKPQGSVTYTILIWLHENWQDQENDEGKSFAAGITFSTSLGGSGVTANLSVSN